MPGERAGAPPHMIFLSWQSDTPTMTGRNLINRALELAIRSLHAEATVEPAERGLAVDMDTQGVPGSPPILDTILGKIDAAAVFVSDLTYVATRLGGGRVPNPNVCIEHGYALKALSWRRVVAVMNTAHGGPREYELPFDLRHARHPITFDCPDDADDATRRSARDALAKDLATALRAILGDATALASLRPPAPAEPHPHDVGLLAAFRKQFSPELRLLLRKHDFGGPFQNRVCDPIHEVSERWLGAQFEFHDAEVQAVFEPLLRMAGELAELLLVHTHPMDGNVGVAWPKTRMDVMHGMQPTTVAAIAAINGKASELTGAIDAFERVARDRVRSAVTVTDATQADRLAARRTAAQTLLDELAADPNRGAYPEIVRKPDLVLRLVPWEAIDRPRLDPVAVGRAQSRFPPSVGERVHTDVDGRQWWSCAPPRREQDAPSPETAWLMRLVRPGVLEYRVSIGQALAGDTEILIDGRWLEAMIVRNLDRMAAIAVELGLVGPATIQLCLEDVGNVRLTRARPGRRQFRSPQIVLSSTEVQDVGNPVADSLRDSLDVVWQEAGWPDGSPSFSNGAWAGYGNPALYQLD